MFHWPGSELWFIQVRCSPKALARVLVGLPISVVLLSFPLRVAVFLGLKRAE